VTKYQAIEAVKRAKEIRVFCKLIVDESGREQGAYYRIKRKAALEVTLARAHSTDTIKMREAPGEPGVLLVG
jgi:hypothetical protein